MIFWSSRSAPLGDTHQETMNRHRAILLACLVAVAATAAPGLTPARDRLRVATGHQAPFVMKENGALTGFSVDLWKEIARRIGVDFEWLDLGSSNEQMDAIVQGRADVAISAIKMTPDRENLVDFSAPYLESGLQIMVPVSNEGTPLWSVIHAAISATIREVAVVVMVVYLLLAHVLWLVERGSNPRFQKGYVRGILEGLWGVALIIATGEYGDRDTPSVVRRLTVALVWLFGMVLVAQFTASVTSSLTVRHLRATIQGPEDLPGKRVGTLQDTVASDYLTTFGIPYLVVKDHVDGARKMKDGEVQAIVFDAPTLQYWAAREGRGVVQVVGPIFRPESFAIAVPEGSKLRKKINQALLSMYADGTYESFRSKWFTAVR